ncbi:Toxoplasma gondii family A protein [Besnoitia besnoiti]|uniref:Toxoplasma gondii family A protein n=1 Tax=Besnoitia besnoiti TaxID=94643 RepID=A0A2A9MFN1_BESBE|nr:Toxoplasma gondii family A protein [Besnoitia besnoiti]PFH36729.1 Toxoplasma gondii family A protein [Besnoitia besnoiti]
MAPVLLRALSSSLLVGAVLNCHATDAGGGLSVDPETIITIPEKGLEADDQKIVWLGPSQALRIVDSSNAAIFLPQHSTENPSPTPSSEQMNAVAYPFENGACDFKTVVEYKKLFPAYEEPLWVRNPASAQMAAGEGSPAPAANYTFTNPPADALNGATSFCVRFVFKPPKHHEAGRPAGTGPASDESTAGHGNRSVRKGEGDKDVDTGPRHPGSASQQNQSRAVLPGKARRAVSHGEGVGASVESGIGSSGVPKPLPEPAEKEEDPGKADGEHNTVAQTAPAPPAPPSLIPSVVGNAEESLRRDQGEKNQAESLDPAGVPDGKLPGPPSPTLSNPVSGKQDSEHANGLAAAHGSGGLASNDPVGSRAEQDAQDEEERAKKVEAPDTRKRAARLRRLSEATTANEKYLTIIVHSSAWSVAGRLAAASIFATAAWLLTTL